LKCLLDNYALTPCRSRGATGRAIVCYNSRRRVRRPNEGRPMASLSLRIDIDPEGRIGPGKIALL
jgi:hypothetical protein